MIKVRTNKEINIAHYSALQPEMVKLEFMNIGFRYISAKDKYIITYDEYAVLGEDIVNTVEKIDENGLYVHDESGEIVMEEITTPNTKYLRTVTKEINSEDFNTISNIVKSQLPDNLTQTQINDEILKTGIKLFIVNNGYYQGNFTLNDFE
jgi:hypothetical protein